MHPLASHFHPKFPGLISHLSCQRKHSILLTKFTTTPNASTIPKKPVRRLEPANKNKKHLLELIFNSFDDFISKFIDLPLAPSIDPDHVLSGNFAPVEELPPTPCEVVEGSLPSCLDGVYIRNGPNPQFIPRGPYHLLDGDGMLHSIRISCGAANFCSRYIKTYKFMTEGNMGYPFFVSPFSSFNGKLASAARFFLVVARGVSGYFNPVTNGFGTANTSLAFFGGTLYAFCESDLPYEIEVTSGGEIVTLGRRDFGGNPWLRMTAHPQIDSDTGEVFAFRCNMGPPFLTFFRIDSAGRKGPDLPINSIKKMPCVVHDFALTKRFIIFQDGQLEMDLLEMVRGRVPLVCNHLKLPRIGILPRGATDDDGGFLWIEAAGLNMLHVINAWEEDCGGRIVILAPNFLSVENGFHPELFHSELEMIALDINAKRVVSRHVLCSQNTEFGVINQAYAGKKNKYMYAAVIAPDEMPKAAGVVKLDLSIAAAGGGDCTVASRVYGAGCYGGETFFVARDIPAAEEDDGYLVTYVHDENSMESWFWVMDAKTPALDIVARIRLPGRVPYGFHGIFVSQTQLK